jgi:hypothetical protein
MKPGARSGEIGTLSFRFTSRRAQRLRGPRLPHKEKAGVIASGLVGAFFDVNFGD